MTLGSEARLQAATDYQVSLVSVSGEQAAPANIVHQMLRSSHFWNVNAVMTYASRVCRGYWHSLESSSEFWSDSGLKLTCSRRNSEETFLITAAAVEFARI
jgi:hypothetical protein